MKVLIAGGGIGGLTTALCCLRRGFDVEVFEEAPEFGEVGAGLQISPNALKVLDYLGLTSALREVAFKPRALEMRDGHSGRQVFEIPLDRRKESQWGGEYFHVHRADLLNVLLEELKAVAPGSTHTGRKITGYTNDKDKITVSVGDGSSATGDVLVGADGIHSRVKQVMLGADPARFTGNIAWRGTLQSTEELKKLVPETATVWTGNKRHAVTYYLRGGDLINFVGVVEDRDWCGEHWKQVGDPAQLQALFKDFAPPIQAITNRLQECFHWALHDRMPLRAWSDKRAVLIGDAAHPMLPFLAQGAVMAIEDAYALSFLLAKYSQTPEEALMYFEATRKPRTSKVQARSRANMHVFHQTGTKKAPFLYGPMKIAATITPGIVTARQDWLYSHDVINAYA